MIRSVALAVVLLIAFAATACAPPPAADDEAPAAAAAQELGATTNGLPGGGGGIPWCCFHPGTNVLWQPGEIGPGGVVLTAASIATLCPSGALPDRRLCH